jgi:hypothetical protein
MRESKGGLDSQATCEGESPQRALTEQGTQPDSLQERVPLLGDGLNRLKVPPQSGILICCHALQWQR